MWKTGVRYWVGVDPGTVDAAVTVLRVDAETAEPRRLRWVAGEAKVSVRGLGHWVSTKIPAGALWDGAVAAVVEVPRGAIYSGARSDAVLRAAFTAGEVVNELRHLMIEPRQLTAVEIRAQMLGKVPRIKGATDRATKAWLRLHVAGTPPRTSTHVRDAAMAAAAGAAQCWAAERKHARRVGA